MTAQFIFQKSSRNIIWKHFPSCVPRNFFSLKSSTICLNDGRHFFEVYSAIFRDDRFHEKLIYATRKTEIGFRKPNTLFYVDKFLTRTNLIHSQLEVSFSDGIYKAYYRFVVFRIPQSICEGERIHFMTVFS